MNKKIIITLVLSLMLVGMSFAADDIVLESLSDEGTDTATSAAPRSGSQVTVDMHPIKDKEGKIVTKVPVSDRNLLFEQQGNTWKRKSGVSYLGDNTWKVGDETVQYSKDGLIKIEGEDVQLWSVNGYGQSLPKEAVSPQILSAVNWEQYDGSKTIPLKGEGSVTISTDSLTGGTVRSQTITVGDEKLTETKIILPGGKGEITTSKKISNLEELRSGDKVSFNGDEATYKENGVFEIETAFTTKEVKVKKLSDSNSVVTTTFEDKTIIEEMVNLETKEVSVEKYEKGKLVSWTIENAEGNEILEGEIDSEGNVVQANHYNPETGKLRAVSFYSDNLGPVKNNPSFEETKIEIIDTDTIKIVGRSGSGGKTYKEDQIETQLSGDLKSQAKQAILTAERQAFWRGETDPQRYIQTARSFGYELRPGWHGLSNLLAPDVTRNWQEEAARTFGRAMLVEPIVTQVCAEQPKVAGEGVRLIKTRTGTYQFVGSIQAERTDDLVPILCTTEEDEEGNLIENVCLGDMVCKQGLCFEDEDDKEPAKGHFYKITWGVTAPQDEKLTPFVDENGVAITFNIQFTGADFWLLEDESGRSARDTEELKNGESDGRVILHYSAQRFDEICILFDKGPIPGIVNAFQSPNEVKEICADIVSTSLQEATEEAKQRRSSRSTQTGEVRVNRNW